MGADSQCRPFAGHFPCGMCTHVKDRGSRQSVGRARAIFHRCLQRVFGDADCVRRLDHLIVFASLYAHRGRAWAGFGPATAAVSQHVPAVHGHDADRPHDEQHGTHVGGDGSRDLVHRAARDAVPDPRESRGGLEVLHSLRRGHLPSPVRHHSHVFCGRENLGFRGRERAALDPSQRGQGPARARRSRSGIRVLAGGIRHQGGSRAAAQLAARCAR